MYANNECVCIGRVMILWEEGGIELKKDLRQINGARLDL